MNKQDYLKRLKFAIERVQKCDAYYIRSVWVTEKFKRKIVWKGEVDVFALIGHPKAKHCYGWSYGEPEEFITILELPPVDSPQSAIKSWGVLSNRKKEE